MPDIDGLGLAAMVRADPGIPLPTFVLLTSRGERLQPAQMEEHGLAACELKPVHPDKLRFTLARVVDTRSGRTSGMLTITNRVTNTADAQRAMRTWARALRDALDSLYKPAA